MFNDINCKHYSLTKALYFAVMLNNIATHTRINLELESKNSQICQQGQCSPVSWTVYKTLG